MLWGKGSRAGLERNIWRKELFKQHVQRSLMESEPVCGCGGWPGSTIGGEKSTSQGPVVVGTCLAA